MKQDEPRWRFRIRWELRYPIPCYTVSVPSYEGGEVVDAESYDALRNEYLKLMAEQEWVKVSERKPEKDGRYLVARSNNFPRVDIEWFATSDHAFFDDGEEDTNVIYWRPITLPEQEEKCQ